MVVDVVLFVLDNSVSLEYLWLYRANHKWFLLDKDPLSIHNIERVKQWSFAGECTSTDIHGHGRCTVSLLGRKYVIMKKFSST